MTPRENYASYDEPGPARRGMSDSVRAGLAARRSACTESVEISIVRPIEEFSIPWPGTQPPPMVTTVTSHVHPGKVADYIEVTAELVEAMRKKGIEGFGGHRVAWGGSRQRVMTGRAVEKMAVLDGPGVLSSAMDEDARADWLERRRVTYAAPNEYDIWVYEADLSFHPPE